MTAQRLKFVDLVLLTQTGRMDWRDISTRTKLVTVVRVVGGRRAPGRVVVTPHQGPKFGKEQEYSVPTFLGYWEPAP